MPPAAHNVNWNPSAALSRLVQPGYDDIGASAFGSSSRSSGLRSATLRADQTGQDAPLENWEVAYIYGYLTRFTEWRTLDGSLPDVSVLEQELVNSSPPEGSRLIKTPPPPRGPNNHYIMPWQLDENDEVFAMGLTTTINAPTIAGENEEEMRLPPLPVDAAVATVDGDANGGTDSAGPGTPGGDDGGDGLMQPSDQNLPTWSTLSWGKLTEQDLAAEGGIPPSSPLLVEIIKSLEKFLYLPEFEQSHGRRDWFSWLVRFTNKRLYSWGRGGFRWTHNLLKRVGVKSGSEREQEFWLLRWEDKVHLIRQMIDFTLMNVKHVRKTIDDSYDSGRQRVSRRGDNSNELAVECLGQVDDSWIWKIDDSPRLYRSSNPFASSDIRDLNAPEFEWTAAATTVEGYKNFLESLPEPDWSLIHAKMVKVAEEEALEALGFKPDGTPLDPPASEKTTSKSGGGKPAKKKQKIDTTASDSASSSSKIAVAGTNGPTLPPPKPEIELNPVTGRPNVSIAQALMPHNGKKTKGQKAWEEQSKETLLRARLEEDLPYVLEFQKGLEQCSVKRMREQSRTSSNSRQSRTTNVPAASARGNRPQRNVRQPDYTYPGLQLDDGAWITSSGRTSRRTRHSLTDSDAAAAQTNGHDEDSSSDWKGERRSSRIHHRKEGGVTPAWELESEGGQALTPKAEGVESATAPESATAMEAVNGDDKPAMDDAEEVAADVAAMDVDTKVETAQTNGDSEPAQPVTESVEEPSQAQNGDA
ncbi:hypothetical protein ACM66B_003162 [Microbotryomycetes sp. NB124-2]